MSEREEARTELWGWLRARKEGRMSSVSLVTCVREAVRHPGLLEEFDRLGGWHLSKLDRRSPVDAMIDEATGRDEEACRAFVAFVRDVIWLPLLLCTPQEGEDHE